MTARPKIIKRDAKGRYLPGSNANPKGPGKKGTSLTDILRATGNKKRRVRGMTVTGRKLLANLIWQAATEGEVKFPKGRVLKVKNLKDWHTIVSWLYDRVDGKPTEHTVIEDPQAEITAEDLTQAMVELEKWKKNRGG